MNRIALLLAGAMISLACIFIACSHAAGDNNQLTSQEKEAGWILLFDGKSTKGWHIYHEGDIPSAWSVRDGELYCDPASKAFHGDLVSDSEFENFELQFDWKITRGGNSGVFINVVERPDIPYSWSSGAEYQLLDVNHPDFPDSTKRSGCLFGFAPQLHPVANKPTGEWNHSRIIHQNGKVEFYLNGTLTVQQDFTSQAWRDWVAQTHFKDSPEFTKHTSGHIALQEWSRGIAFRNIKLKPL